MNSTTGQQSILIYQQEDGGFATEVRLVGETVWLTQKQMAELFDTSTDNIGLHLKNIHATGELDDGGNYRGFLGSSSRRQAKGGAPA